MPKDLSKLSLKEFDLISEGETEQRMRWNKGSLTGNSFRREHREEDDRDE